MPLTVLGVWSKKVVMFELKSALLKIGDLLLKRVTVNYLGSKYGFALHSSAV